MPRLFTVGDVVLAAKQQADMENSDFISSSEWKRMLHSVWGEFYSEIVNSGLRYFETTLSIASSSLTSDGDGGASIALPDDYLAHIGVDRQEGDRWCQLDELMVQERNWPTGSSSGKATTFAVIGQRLHLYPVPPSGQTYRMLYIPQPQSLRNEDDNAQIDVITPDGEMFIVWALSVMALAKEESDTSVAMAERTRFLKRVQEWAAERSFNTPRRVQVMRDPTGNPFGAHGFGDPGDYRY